MSVVLPKAEREAASDPTTNPPLPFQLASDGKHQSVDRPQSQPDLEQGPPSRADTLFVLTWIAAIAAAAGLIIFAALANL